MSKYLVLAVDVAIFAIMGVVAFLVRQGQANNDVVFRYSLISIVVALPVFMSLGLHRHFFRYFSLMEFYHAAVAIGIAVLATISIAFTHFRLVDVPRTVPLLHFIIAIAGISSFRVFGRTIGRRRSSRSDRNVGDGSGREGAVIVGFNPLCDLCLRSIELLNSKTVFVVGILDEDYGLLGHRIRFRQVIGQPQNLSGILARYRIQGVRIERVILTQPLDELSEASRKVIQNLEKSGLIAVDDFSKRVSLPVISTNKPEKISDVQSHSARQPLISQKLQLAIDNRREDYATFKRAADIAASVVLIVILAPIAFLLVPAVYLTMGSPVLFWQERPGKNGRIFRLYKFRTMLHGVVGEGQILNDDERQTRVGNFLRRGRLDELPQLFNVLKGDMSFIGPRPLMPIDLPSQVPQWIKLRSQLQPGISGWAQVNGGKDVGKTDKVILDIWYAKNMSLALDIKIVWLTLKMIFLGESLKEQNIKMAYEDLGIPFEGIQKPPKVNRSSDFRS